MFLIICVIMKMHFKRLLQIQILQLVFTACTRQAHGALEDPQRCHSVPTARCQTHCANAKPRRRAYSKERHRKVF